MNIKQLIHDKFPVQYVYSYPTTRSYAPVENFLIQEAIFTKDINVYIHIPFCNQKCSFCGYLTVIEKHEAQRDLYVDALIQEINAFKPYAIGKVVRSINFGGGTPSLLSQKQVQKIMNTLQRVFPDFHKSANEISMEATPESINYQNVEHLYRLGFNRISIGIQTLHAPEIVKTGRHNSSNTSITAMETIRKAGIENLCVDLMYGLPLQTAQTWQSTLQGVLEYKPETIELYRTVIIPGTRLSRQQNPLNLSAWNEKYEAYQYARSTLIDTGYAQDSHVRFVLPGKGFYEQQTNVFKGQSLIGFGVGARTYATNVHYRNCYSVQNSKSAVERYIHTVTTSQPVAESASFLTNEERARRYAIYNLEKLNVDYITRTYGVDLTTEIIKSGLFKQEKKHFILDTDHLYHRDLIAYSLFSKENLSLEKGYYGDFLKDW